MHGAAYKNAGYIALNKYAARSKIGEFREAAAIKLFYFKEIKPQISALQSATAKFNAGNFKPVSKTAEMKF